MLDQWLGWIGGDTYLGAGEIALRLAAAIALSCLVGLERELKSKPFGLRTHMLVALGAASFCMIAIELLHSLERTSDAAQIDPTRVIEGVIGGIGFLGAGAIIQGRDRILGATTGAGIWVVGGIGMACGFGLYFHAAVVAVLALFVLWILGLLEDVGSSDGRSA